MMSSGSPKSFAITRHIVTALAIIVALVVGVGGWAATANLTGAVIAPGAFVVERNVKKVQHSYGGIVAEINVRNGDRVVGGDVLLRLDATQIRAELGVLRSQIIELTARSSRLAAERNGRTKVVFPKGFVESGSEAAEASEGEARLFEDSLKTRDSQKEQLRFKVQQTMNEILGLTAQRDAKAGELEIVNKELAEVRSLHAKQLTTASRLNVLERDFQRLSGERGGLTAQISRANGHISEINVQILSVDENSRANAQRELRVSESKLLELGEKEVAAKDKLHRVDIRAPRAGLVHELSVHTVGGVVTAAEQLMLIVPEDDSLAIQARIQPQEIDQVTVGRPARLRLSAFNQQTTPELEGRIVHVAGDVTNDAKTGQAHYAVRVEMDEKSRKLVGDLKLMPGMPVEVFLSTGERTALSYLAKPFVDQMKRAFREQ